MTRPWFLPVTRRPSAAVRLVCLPYAGAGAGAFRTWGEALPDSVDVVAVQAPGKGWRIGESPISDLHRLADAVADAVVPLADRPFLLFGHSMGAWTGWEVARRLEERGLRPSRLVASGRQAPSAGHLHDPLSHLPDAEFVAAIQARYGGIPEAILREPDVLELLLPALRADVEALEGYQPPDRPIATPILALGGASDPVVPRESIDGWRDATEGGAEVLILPGGHFFFEDDDSDFFGMLRDRCLEGVRALRA